MRRFELSDGKCHKYWEVASEGTSVTVRFGRIGTAGQTQTKSLADEAKARAELSKLVKEKTKKGYIEVVAAPTGDKPPTPAVPSPPVAKVPAAPPAPAADDGFIGAGQGYALAIRDGRVVARNAKGQILGSVPKDLREGDVGEQLSALVEWLGAHARAAVEWTETWMLRSLPVPTAAITSVWQDDAYRASLENLVIFAARADGSIDRDRGGLLKGSDEARGVGIVDRDGETSWIRTKTVFVPHPIVIDGLDDWRALATELGVTQGAQQLFREVFSRSADTPSGAREVTRYEGGAFKQLSHAIGTSKSLGYRVSGGSAVMRVVEQGRTVEARYWIGDEDPMAESVTGSLVWVDDKQSQLALEEVAPVAFSEGMRMAAAIYAKRFIEEKKEEA